MKKLSLLVLCVVHTALLHGQQTIIDSIKHLMPSSNDTLMLVWSSLLGREYSHVNTDSNMLYNKKYLAYCQKLNFSLQEADALFQNAFGSSGTNDAEAIKMLYAAQQIIEHPANTKILPAPYREMQRVPASVTTYEQYQSYVLANVTMGYGYLYWLNGRDKRCAAYFYRALEINQRLRAPDITSTVYLMLGVLSENEDSSLYYLHKSRQVSIDNKLPDNGAGAEAFLAQCYGSKKESKLELFYRQFSLNKNIRHGYLVDIGWGYVGLADYYQRSVIIPDSQLVYAKKALSLAEKTNSPNIAYWALWHLSQLYKDAGNKDTAYKYLEMLLQAKEKISSDEKQRQFDNIDYTRLTQQAAIETANREFRNRVKTYSFLAGIAILFLLAIIFWRDNRRKQSEFLVLQKQKAKTDAALRELRATQAQLIQSEKMASLGELTAGIAHEIQNPLNFVNNFSEVNRELISELVEEVDKGNTEEIKAIANDIKDNEEKINHHGKRADAIVKGMLQHSQKSTGQKEPTDINALADEYLRLSYHGLRAKDKSFNANLKTYFDDTVGKINIIPQEVGRVLLNLYNNAFYAVNEKKQMAIAGYEPTVSISTKKVDHGVEISVADNGNGVPRKVLEKIFQPFFTTKPTGQGTGLGLSLSYDIIKAHGGEIRVDTREGEGATFVLQLSTI